MPIDNAVMLGFCNETIRPLADRLGGLLPLLGAVPDAVIGKGIASILGTTNADLFKAAPWTDADYAAIPVQTIVGSDSSNRTLLTNHDVIGVLRVIAALGAMKAANPALGPLIGRVAVNPRA